MKIVNISLIVVSTTFCFGQSGYYCGKKSKLTISEIKKKFPFNKTETIKLVSFKNEYLVMQESDTVEVPISELEIPKTNGIVDLTKMFEVKALDIKGAEKVLNILVNYDNDDRPSQAAACYEPRNGIVFFDKDDKVLGYVEICFECRRFKTEPTTIEIPRFCEEKFNALKVFFSNAGIKYGIRGSEEE